MISTIELKNKVATITPTNHFFVCDVSGSMYSVLPKMRKLLKDSLPTLVKSGDTVSVIYFSGSTQCGTVFVGEEINSNKDLTDVNKAIDKYLTTIGLTSFIKPLELAYDTAKDLSSNGNLNSLVFLTDGGHNEGGSRDSILKSCEKLPMVFSDINFIEYGYWVDRKLIEDMTSAANALHAFTETYDNFVPVFEDIIVSGKSVKIEVEVGDATHAVFVDGDRIYTVAANGGIALVPEHVNSVWAVGTDAEDAVDSITDEQLLYVILYHGLHIMNPDLVWKVLKKLGDVRLIKAYDNCFTKQDYSNVKDLISQAVLKPETRFVDGIDYNMVPDENATTVIDVLNVLIDANASVDVKSEHFSYNRTGRASVQKEDTTIAELSEQIANAATVEERKALAAKLVEHEEWKPEFTSTQELVAMNKIVTNGNRPNISISTSMNGFVTIPLGYQVKYGLPETVASKITRNYTIVKDGIINMKTIPVIMPLDKLAGVVEAGAIVEMYQSTLTKAGEVAVLVHVGKVPLVNRAMTKGLSGKDFLTKNVELHALKARQKVLKFYREELVGKVNAVGLAGLYGDEAAKMLSEKGIRDYGFSPLVAKTEATDFYMSKELNVKVKGLSSLPAVNAVLKKVQAGKKLNAGDFVMHEAIREYEGMKLVLTEDQLKDWIKDETKETIDKVRVLQGELSKIMYGIVVAHSWFCDMELDESAMTVSYNGFSFDTTIELEEKKITI